MSKVTVETSITVHYLGKHVCVVCDGSPFDPEYWASKSNAGECNGAELNWTDAGWNYIRDDQTETLEECVWQIINGIVASVQDWDAHGIIHHAPLPAIPVVEIEIALVGKGIPLLPKSVSHLFGHINDFWYILSGNAVPKGLSIFDTEWNLWHSILKTAVARNDVIQASNRERDLDDTLNLLVENALSRGKRLAQAWRSSFVIADNGDAIVGSKPRGKHR